MEVHHKANVVNKVPLWHHHVGAKNTTASDVFGRLCSLPVVLPLCYYVKLLEERASIRTLRPQRP